MTRHLRQPQLVLICPHPEEGRRPVSKEDQERTGASFETPASQAPQDEVSGAWSRKEGTC